MEKQNFINNIANACIALYDKYKILPSLTIAQAICESAWGKSSLSSKHFNFFGMKWTSTCGCKYVEYNTKEFVNGAYVTVKAKFRSYGSFAEGIEGYYKFITGYKRYHNLINETDSYTACKKIKDDGWATSPTYTNTLYNLVTTYNLQRFDDIVLNRNTETLVAKVNELPQFKNEEIIAYVVKKNDSLWKIAENILGDGNRWIEIFEYNNLKSTTIYPNQILNIKKGV